MAGCAGFCQVSWIPSTLTFVQLRAIESRMNATPRKCLGFMTPQEAFAAAAG